MALATTTSFMILVSAHGYLPPHPPGPREPGQPLSYTDLPTNSTALDHTGMPVPGILIPGLSSTFLGFSHFPEGWLLSRLGLFPGKFYPWSSPLWMTSAIFIGQLRIPTHDWLV